MRRLSPIAGRDFGRCPGSLGAVLSQAMTSCSFTFLFPLRVGSFGVKTRNYITSLTLHKAAGGHAGEV